MFTTASLCMHDWIVSGEICSCQGFPKGAGGGEGSLKRLPRGDLIQHDVVLSHPNHVGSCFSFLGGGRSSHLLGFSMQLIKNLRFMTSADVFFGRAENLRGIILCMEIFLNLQLWSLIFLLMIYQYIYKNNILETKTVEFGGYCFKLVEEKNLKILLYTG